MRLHMIPSVFAKHDRDLRAKMSGRKNRLAKILKFSFSQKMGNATVYAYPLLHREMFFCDFSFSACELMQRKPNTFHFFRNLRTFCAVKEVLGGKSGACIGSAPPDPPAAAAGGKTVQGRNMNFKGGTRGSRVGHGFQGSDMVFNCGARISTAGHQFQGRGTIFKGGT